MSKKMNFLIKCHLSFFSEKPSFKKGLKDVEVSEGEDVTFNIKLAGTPKPSVKW